MTKDEIEKVVSIIHDLNFNGKLLTRGILNIDNIRHALADLEGEEKCNCFGCWLHENYDYENESWWHKVDEEGEQPLETEELYQEYIKESLPKCEHINTSHHAEDSFYCIDCQKTFPS